MGQQLPDAHPPLHIDGQAHRDKIRSQYAHFPLLLFLLLLLIELRLTAGESHNIH
jgi:hypothetical protein